MKLINRNCCYCINLLCLHGKMHQRILGGQNDKLKQCKKAMGNIFKVTLKGGFFLTLHANSFRLKDKLCFERNSFIVQLN